ncbi:MAG: radical SAM family heme chaperone HemW, partial [Lachnospiraceae bacterium]|nr:radical SAM family heme chaperone HemW [Lachnospiraceae bacterium]
YVALLCDHIKSEGEGLFLEKKPYLSSIYIGGGTPSLLTEDQIRRIMGAVKEYFDIDENAEISIEVNPATVTEEKAKTFASIGINRVSIGLQSANECELKCLGRIHDYADFEKSFSIIRNAGINNINVDIMGAIPGQTAKTYLETLRKVIALNPEHISAYSLILEPGTPMFEKYYDDECLRAKGEDPKFLPTEEEERKIYHEGKRFLEENGFKQYEISNFAKQGFECRHNIGYWNGTDYIGVGLAASSYLDFSQMGAPGFARFTCYDDFGDYMFNGRRGEFSPKYDILSKEDMMSEFCYLGMRMTDGISRAEFKKRFGEDLDTVFEYGIKTHVKNGLLESNGDNLRLTEKGLDLCNMVFCDFIIEKEEEDGIYDPRGHKEN